MDYKKMKKMRLHKGLSQRTLSKMLDILPQSYNYVETGKRDLPKKVLIKYQQIMEISDAEMWQLFISESKEEE